MSKEILERLTKIETKFDQFYNNEFVHLKAIIDKIDNRIWTIIGVTTVGILTQIILKLI